MKKIALGALGLAIGYTVMPTVFTRTFSKQIHKQTFEKGILLTFDDGPNPHYTPLLLDVLRHYNIQAIFFVVAKKAAQYPDLIKQMKQDGHLIGIHHYTHQSSFFMSPSSLEWHLQKSKQVLEQITEEKIELYRPPWGHMNLATPILTKPFHVVMWSNAFGDWKTKNCKTTLLKKLHQARVDGSIYLLHDCGETLGADNDAPGHMLIALQQFLAQSTLEGQTFTNPHYWINSYA